MRYRVERSAQRVARAGDAQNQTDSLRRWRSDELVDLGDERVTRRGGDGESRRPHGRARDPGRPGAGRERGQLKSERRNVAAEGAERGDQAMRGAPGAPLRELDDHAVAVAPRARSRADASIARRWHGPGERILWPRGGGDEQISGQANSRPLGTPGGFRPVSGAWARHARPRHPPCSSRADSTARPGLRRDCVATTTRGRHSKPLAGFVWRGYQVRWCYLHPHLQELSEATTVREHCSRDRNSSLLPVGGGVKLLGPLRCAGRAHLARPRI